MTLFTNWYFIVIQNLYQHMIHINIIKEEKNNSYNILKAEEIEKKEKNTQF
jgi:hypothetical protein